MNKMTRIISLLILVVLCAAMLASCGVSSYANRLQKAGYETDVASRAAIKEQNEREKERAEFKDTDVAFKYQGFLVAQTSTDYIEVYKFASAKQAKQFASDFKSVPDAFECVEVKGKFVFVGTTNAVAAAMGN